MQPVTVAALLLVTRVRSLHLQNAAAVQLLLRLLSESIAPHPTALQIKVTF